ncbi:MAG: Crp/Fnr family transcriptional regulator [Clostridia bacterium]|nr:Crp/Fnr family transcriptional regulator [Clostridia bacterium]
MNIDIKEINNVFKKYLGKTASEESILKVANGGILKTFKKGELILGIGERMTTVYYILNGLARSYYIDNDGNDITKAFLCENSFCVIESFFTNEPSCQSFEAIENMTVLEYDADVLKSVIFALPELKELYIKMLEETIVYKMRRESSFQLESATERYLNFKKMMPNIENRVKQSYIASYLGITPVSLSRIKRALREDFI